MNKILSAAAAVAMACAAFGANAQGYVGAAVGSSHYDIDCSGVSACDKRDTGFKAFVGYGFGNGFAVEATYFRFGDFSGLVNIGNAVVAGTGEGTALGIGGAYMADFSPTLRGVVRLGVARNKLEASASSGGVSVSDSQTETKPYVGLGLGYKLAPNMSLDFAADFTRFEFDGEGARARMITIGLTYAF